MSGRELDEIQNELDAFSKPVTMCAYCDIPVYAITPTEKPMCLQCWAYKDEYDRITATDEP